MTKRPTTSSKPDSTEAAMTSHHGPIGEGVAFITRVNRSATLSFASWEFIAAR
jgi:hypothetical protein